MSDKPLSSLILLRWGGNPSLSAMLAEESLFFSASSPLFKATSLCCQSDYAAVTDLIRSSGTITFVSAGSKNS